MTDTNVTEPPTTAYVRYSRTISPKQYEKAEASVSLPVDLADPTRTLDQSSVDTVQYGLGIAVQLTNGVLGIDALVPSAQPVIESNGARVPDTGAIATLGNAFPGAVEVANPHDGAEHIAAPPAAPAPTAAPAAGIVGPNGVSEVWRVHGSTSKTAPRRCPQCGGEMWDNSVDKRNPKAPDGKCKDKSCNGAIWLTAKS